ncbi:26S proteasome non-ATPase regulatory subunit 9 [Termitomyces sp. T112]|nr:26S proteasome non-ATPase regulatory subunit 9 [Termitomyces sp. T112]
MEQAQTLIEKKSNIEDQIETQISILKANNSTMQTPLVDADGFPRADIDVYAVRSARARIITLRNDLNAVINDIAKALETIYNPASAPKDSEPDSSSAELGPFAKVNTVAPQSPAAEAGLQRDDLIVKFGPLNCRTCSSSLQPLTEVVSANENKHIILKVLRSGQTVHITLTPRMGWGGRGMLGCHIIPYSSAQ